MTTDRVRGEDNPPIATLNTGDLSGRYRVVADRGVLVAAGKFEGGSVVDLSHDEAFALTRERSVERLEDTDAE